jgi:hypothetical protein
MNHELMETPEFLVNARYSGVFILVQNLFINKAPAHKIYYKSVETEGHHFAKNIG